MKKVDSRRNAPFVIASGACTAWQSINTPKRILVWIATPLSRLAMTEKGAQMSKATNLPKQLGGRICDEKPLLCKASAEIRLGRLSHKRAAAIKGLSRKANAKRSGQ